MKDLTRALFSAIEAALRPQFSGGMTEMTVSGFTVLRDSKLLRDTYADAPESSLYIELPPTNIETRALWFELQEAGANPPMTAITPGEGNGVAVLLFPDGIEFYITSDNEREGTMIAQLAPQKEGQTPSWSFQRG